MLQLRLCPRNISTSCPLAINPKLFLHFAHHLTIEPRSRALGKPPARYRFTQSRDDSSSGSVQEMVRQVVHTSCLGTCTDGLLSTKKNLTEADQNTKRKPTRAHCHVYAYPTRVQGTNWEICAKKKNEKKKHEVTSFLLSSPISDPREINGGAKNQDKSLKTAKKLVVRGETRKECRAFC